MDIYSIFTLIGGLAFFLYGISVMSQGLEKTASGRLENLLKKMTSNPLKSFALGAGITAIIQSSSAVTVMLIGLVNSGIMSLSQTVSVVIGSNVGTTITAWLLSLTGIQETAGSFLKLLKPESFAPVLAFAGILAAFALTVIMTGKLSPYLPKDGGREFAHDGKLSAGKPRGAGIIFVLVFVASVLLFVPLQVELEYLEDLQ